MLRRRGWPASKAGEGWLSQVTGGDAACSAYPLLAIHRALLDLGSWRAAADVARSVSEPGRESRRTWTGPTFTAGVADGTGVVMTPVQGHGGPRRRKRNGSSNGYARHIYKRLPRSDPFVVIVLSLSFIASIFFLHIAAKIVRAFTK